MRKQSESEDGGMRESKKRFERDKTGEDIRREGGEIVVMKT